MKLLTAELKGKALDWALNHALMLEHGFVPEIAGALGEPSEMYNHTDPAVCLQSMQQIHIAQQASDGSWRVATSKGVIIEGCVSTRHHELYGKTLAEAVARCVVQMQLGDEVEVPDELVGERS